MDFEPFLPAVHKSLQYNTIIFANWVGANIKSFHLAKNLKHKKHPKQQFRIWFMA